MTRRAAPTDTPRPDPVREAAVAAGRARMDAARAASGNLTCDLTVCEIDEIRNVPAAWSAVWRSREE